MPVVSVIENPLVSLICNSPSIMLRSSPISQSLVRSLVPSRLTAASLLINLGSYDIC